MGIDILFTDLKLNSSLPCHLLPAAILPAHLYLRAFAAHARTAHTTNFTTLYTALPLRAFAR